MAGGGPRVRVPPDARATHPVRTVGRHVRIPESVVPRLHRGRDGASRLHGAAGPGGLMPRARRRFGRVGSCRSGVGRRGTTGQTVSTEPRRARSGAARRGPLVAPSRTRSFRGTGSTPTPASSPFGSTGRGGSPSGRPAARTRQLYEGLFRLHIAPTWAGRPADGHHARPGPDLAGRAAGRRGRGGDGGQGVPAPQDDLGDGGRRRLLRSNPCRIRGAATERTAERPLTDQVYALAAAAERFRCLVLLGTFCSLRCGSSLP